MRGPADPPARQGAGAAVTPRVSVEDTDNDEDDMDLMRTESYCIAVPDAAAIREEARARFSIDVVHTGMSSDEESIDGGGGKTAPGRPLRWDAPGTGSSLAGGRGNNKPRGIFSAPPDPVREAIEMDSVAADRPRASAAASAAVVAPKASASAGGSAAAAAAEPPAPTNLSSSVKRSTSLLSPNSLIKVFDMRRHEELMERDTGSGIGRFRSLQRVPDMGDTLRSDMQEVYEMRLRAWQAQRDGAPEALLAELDSKRPSEPMRSRQEGMGPSGGCLSQAARLIPRKSIHSAKYPYYNIKRENRSVVFPFSAMYIKGFWHTVLHAGTGALIAAICACYVLVFLLFTPIYMAISEECGLQLGDESGNKFSDALYLSVETMTTIGYGVPDPYYNGCGWGFICVMGQALLGFCMNAVLFGTVFARVSRAQRRAVSLKFSPKACIREIWGRYFLTFQVCEARKFHVVSSTVNMFAAIQNCYSETPYQLHTLRTIRPDDSTGSNLLLCLPSTVVHELDPWSALTPPTKAGVTEMFPDMSGAYGYRWPSVRQRFDDTLTNNRSGCFCFVCGDSFASKSVLRRHAAHTAAIELKDNGPDGGNAKCLVCGDHFPWKDMSDHYTKEHPDTQFEVLVHNEHWIAGETYNHANVFDARGFRHDGFVNVGPTQYTRVEIQEWMRRTQPEVICILGAVDVATGSNFETQHSYTIEDIEWDAQHKPCVHPDPHTGQATVDFQAFMETIPAPPIEVGGLAEDIQFHL